MVYGLTMKPEEKAAWVAALRSGNYEQGQGLMCQQLITEDKKKLYCCLGVYSEIKKVPKVHMGPAFDFKYPTGGRAGGIPDQTWFMDFFDFTPNTKIKEKSVAIDKLLDACTTMNDGCHGYKKPKSFKQIANWIEKNL